MNIGIAGEIAQLAAAIAGIEAAYQEKSDEVARLSAENEQLRHRVASDEAENEQLRLRAASDELHCELHNVRTQYKDLLGGVLPIWTSLGAAGYTGGVPAVNTDTIHAFVVDAIQFYRNRDSIAQEMGCDGEDLLQAYPVFLAAVARKMSEMAAAEENFEQKNEQHQDRLEKMRALLALP